MPLYDLPDLPYGDDNLERTVSIPAGHVVLEGTLGVPEAATGVVLFAHGSGSSRFSPRNRFVARMLRDAGLGTLLLDLLSRAEEEVDEVTRHHRFDIPMLSDRLIVAIDWLEAQPDMASLPIGLFGASTGGGAALVAAAKRPRRVDAVVSRGGRPDLAGEARDWFVSHLAPEQAHPKTYASGRRGQWVPEASRRRVQVEARSVAARPSMDRIACFG